MPDPRTPSGVIYRTTVEPEPLITRVLAIMHKSGTSYEVTIARGSNVKEYVVTLILDGLVNTFKANHEFWVDMTSAGPLTANRVAQLVWAVHDHEDPDLPRKV